jgi:hypothetical protein
MIEPPHSHGAALDAEKQRRTVPTTGRHAQKTVKSVKHRTLYHSFFEIAICFLKKFAIFLNFRLVFQRLADLPQALGFSRPSFHRLLNRPVIE